MDAMDIVEQLLAVDSAAYLNYYSSLSVDARLNQVKSSKKLPDSVVHVVVDWELDFGDAQVCSVLLDKYSDVLTSVQLKRIFGKVEPFSLSSRRLFSPEAVKDLLVDGSLNDFWYDQVVKVALLNGSSVGLIDVSRLSGFNLENFINTTVLAVRPAKRDLLRIDLHTLIANACLEAAAYDLIDILYATPGSFSGNGLNSILRNVVSSRLNTVSSDDRFWSALASVSKFFLSKNVTPSRSVVSSIVSPANVGRLDSRFLAGVAPLTSVWFGHDESVSLSSFLAPSSPAFDFDSDPSGYMLLSNSSNSKFSSSDLTLFYRSLLQFRLFVANSSLDVLEDFFVTNVRNTVVKNLLSALSVAELVKIFPLTLKDVVPLDFFMQQFADVSDDFDSLVPFLTWEFMSGRQSLPFSSKIVPALRVSWSSFFASLSPSQVRIAVNLLDSYPAVTVSDLRERIDLLTFSPDVAVDSSSVRSSQVRAIKVCSGSRDGLSGRQV